MLKTTVPLACALVAFAAAAQAQIKRLGDPAAAISRTVVVPPGYSVVYLAGTTAGVGGTATDVPDTKAQTLVVLQKLKAQLEAEGLSFADVTMMNVYLVGVPSNGGRMDTAGMNEAYRQFFGTAHQPNKPARVTVQVAQLGGPNTYVEISLQAAKKN